MLIKKLLKKHKYPPEGMEDAVQTVMTQCELWTDNKYPMPLVTSDQDKVYVGRIREDRVLEGGISLFCSGDQIRKGAASNAVQIIKCLYED